MLDTLAKIYDDGGPLVGVSYALFEGDPQFITAVELRFESLTSVDPLTYLAVKYVAGTEPNTTQLSPNAVNTMRYPS
jgi:hypothetical protein